MDNLPEELQLRILEHLDSTPPSELKARQEPNLALTTSSEHPLKTASCLSKHWRRIVLPLLFTHACLRVDTSVRERWLECCLHNDTTLKHADAKTSHAPPSDVDRYHLEMLQASPRSAANMDVISPSWLRELRRGNSPTVYEHSTKAWAARIHHASRDFVTFVANNRLHKQMSSLVLLSDGMQCGKVGRLPSPGIYDWRYEASAAMWQHLLSIFNPSRVAIVAPPVELAWFCNSFVNLDADPDPEAAWAFTDMDYHIIELRQTAPCSRSQLTQPLPFDQLRPIPGCSAHRGIAPSSVFNLREWSSISLNEGSFLKAYGTYEYFERGPPSLISSIASNFAVLGPDNHANLRSFTYTAIFPFANHLDFVHMLPQLETLDLQFAPDPQSGILDDRKRTGRAELQDCWQELISGYHDVATTISTFGMSKEAFPRLKTFICRDAKIPALQEDLGHIFTPLCLPVWAEYEDGVFTRIADKADLPGMDDII